MSWTYSGDPAASPLDALRFAVGDTQAKKPLLSDQELLACLGAVNGNATAAAVTACRGILFQLGRKRNESVGSVSIQYSQEYDHYVQLLGQLTGQLGLFGSFTVYAGGISHQDTDAYEQNRDLIPPDFRKNRERPRVDDLLSNSPQAYGDVDERQ